MFLRNLMSVSSMNRIRFIMWGVSDVILFACALSACKGINKKSIFYTLFSLPFHFPPSPPFLFFFFLVPLSFLGGDGGGQGRRRQPPSSLPLPHAFLPLLTHLCRFSSSSSHNEWRRRRAPPIPASRVGARTTTAPWVSLFSPLSRLAS